MSQLPRVRSIARHNYSDTSSKQLVFEWMLFVYYCFLIVCTLVEGYHNIRIVVYSLLFLLLETLEFTHKQLETDDPLHLNPKTQMVRNLSYLCIANLLWLLLRIFLASPSPSLPATLLILHFLLMAALTYHESRKTSKTEIGVDKANLRRLLSPLVLFGFSTTLNATLSQVSLVQLGLLALNLLAAMELRRILTVRESYFFGWTVEETNGKKIESWNKKKALGAIVVFCCFLIAGQNLLLAFDSVKEEVSLTIAQTFIIALTAFWLYRSELHV